MRLGIYVHIACLASTAGGASIELEDFVAVSQGARVLAGTHDFVSWGFGNSTDPTKYCNVTRAPTQVGRFSILGGNSVVLHGVTAGERAIVRANATIASDLEPRCVFGANGRKIAKGIEKARFATLRSPARRRGMIKPFDEPIYVTRPMLPELQEVYAQIEEIWASKWLSNNGPKHRRFEEEIRGSLKVPYVSLFNNGTTALLVAVKSLGLTGEVITTPFTFAATTHSLAWSGITPVFCDIDDATMNLDPAKVEGLITSKTTGILAVHVYGTPCDVLAIDRIATRHGLKVIYDAAHAFNVEINGTGIGNFGDISMFSFHPTKLFHSGEGGALAFRDADLKPRIELLKNFGIKNEEEVLFPGINGKMNELQAALGLVNLTHLDVEREKRRVIIETYRRQLGQVKGISCQGPLEGVRPSYQYFVIRIDRDLFGLSRDMLYDGLKTYNVFSRKYFYPLCSDYDCYRTLPSANPTRLPIAHRVVREVLCLPLYGGLELGAVEMICEIIKEIQQRHAQG
jgi:dTDP-4-amino-4,6-dideoxygalactose transaminase/carbonic anhydrase/acetyltransferase-like protein (isoleucine patch superfamily)